MAERGRDEGEAPSGDVPLREQLRRLAEAMVVQQQQRASAAVRAVAQGLRRAATGLEPEQNGLVGRYAEDAAAQIERFSETLRRQRLSEMLAQAEDFARRRPVLFLAGAAAGGFILGRMLTAPASRREAAAADRHTDGAAARAMASTMEQA